MNEGVSDEKPKNGVAVSPSPDRSIWLKKLWYGLWGRAERTESALYVESLSGPVRILVVCYGNICRSPVVEALLRGLLPGDRFSIASCGLLPREGTVSPEQYVMEAKRFGIDLSEHRSRYISNTMIEWSNLIVIMDRQNLDLLKDYAPSAVEKTVWMGAWDPSGGLEIPDPFDRSSEEVRAIIARMKRASINLARSLSSASVRSSRR